TYLLPYLKVSKTCFPISEECFPYLDAQTLQGSQIHSITMKDAGFMLSDGTTVWSWSNNSSLFNPHVRFYVDTNGFKKPNVLGKDIFLLFFTSNPAEISSGKKDENGEFALKNTFSYPLGLSIYGEGSGLTLEECLDENTMLGEEAGVNTGSYMACNINSRGELCGLSIKLNNWKIPEGYPKF
ncbi:hypothetical protein IJZ97_03575, partial [bacterium]|nr:hypothetical protein [bacterium]